MDEYGVEEEEKMKKKDKGRKETKESLEMPVST